MKSRIGRNTFQATGITTHLENNRALQNAQQKSSRAGPRTTSHNCDLIKLLSQTREPA